MKRINGVYIFSNETLNRALELRRKARLDFPEDIFAAKRLLDKACDEEKDPYAYFFRARAFWYGGFGILRNENGSIIDSNTSRELGCPFVSTVGLFYDHQIVKTNITKDEEEFVENLRSIQETPTKFEGKLMDLIEFGDEQAMFVFYDVFSVLATNRTKEYFNNILKVATSRLHYFASCRYWGIPSDSYVSKAKLCIGVGELYHLNVCYKNCPDEDDKVRIQYFVGSHGLLPYLKVSDVDDLTFKEECVQLAKTVDTNCRNAVVAWLCSKVLIKDLRRHIGKIIWNKRKDEPFLWEFSKK